MSVMVRYKKDVLDTVAPSVVNELIFSNKINKHLDEAEEFALVAKDLTQRLFAI